MSKFPEYKHEKSQEWFNRALDAIPSGVYGHLGSVRRSFSSYNQMAVDVRSR